MKRITLDLPLLPNRILGRNWRGTTERRDRIYADVALLLLEASEKPAIPHEYAFFHFTRYSPRMCDYDGLVGSCKPVLDGFIRAGWLQDDSPKHVILSYRWEATPRKTQRLTVDFQPFPDCDFFNHYVHFQHEQQNQLRARITEI